MKKHIFILIIIIVHSFETILAQGSWKYFHKEDGLLENDQKIFNIFNDNNKNLWFISDKGINVYNGTSWTSYTDKNGLIGNKISCSYIDSKGNIWVGSYNGEHGDGGISVYDGKEWKQYLKSEKIFNAAHIRYIFEDSKGRIWVANATEGGSYAAGMSAAVTASALPIVGIGYSIISAAIKHGGLSMYENGKWINFNNSKEKPPFNFIKKIFEDSNGKIWFYTDKSQLFRYDENKFEIPGSKEGYSKGDIYDVIVDHNKNIWIGSWDRILKFDGITWTTYGRKDGIIKGLGHFWSFRVLESSDGHIVVPGAQGVCAFDGKLWKNFRYDHVGPYTKHDMETFQSIPDSSGNVWVYYNSNFGQYNGKEWSQEKKQVDSRFFIDSHQRIWFPEKHGLEIKIKNDWIKKEAYQDIFGFVEDKRGNIWAGMQNKGVLFYDGNVWEIFDTSRGLPSLVISNIFSNIDGKVWFSTDKGLCYYQYNN